MIEHSDDEWPSLRAERNRAAAAGLPYAVPVECDVRWDFGAPLPTILQWEHEAHVFFVLRGDGDVGTIVFGGCMASTFGPPGEDGHALEGCGWEAYTPLRVVNSPWPGRLFTQPDGLFHYVLSFHDRTFECLAYSFHASHMPGTMSEAVEAAMSRWQ